MTILGWCFGCGNQVEWEGDEVHGWMPNCCGPVWPGVRVRTQAELEERAPELLLIDAPGHWLEWVPAGQGRLSLGSVPIGDALVEVLTGLRWTREDGYLPGPDWYRVRWIRIAGDPEGPPVDIADVRTVVRQARDAGVPVWVEISCSCDVFKAPDGHCALCATEWAEDLRRCRELPEVSP